MRKDRTEYLHNYNLTHKAEAAARSRKQYLKMKARRRLEGLTGADRPRVAKVPRDRLRLAETGDGRAPMPARPATRPLPSVDSLVGVPCAKFPCLDCHTCDPRTCGKLDEWLQVTDERRREL